MNKFHSVAQFDSVPTLTTNLCFSLCHYELFWFDSVWFGFVLFMLLFPTVYVFWCFSLPLSLSLPPPLIFRCGKYNRPQRKFAIFWKCCHRCCWWQCWWSMVGGGLVNLHLIECCWGESFVQIDLIKCENWTCNDEGWKRKGGAPEWERGALSVRVNIWRRRRRWWWWWEVLGYFTKAKTETNGGKFSKWSHNSFWWGQSFSGV